VSANEKSSQVKSQTDISDGRGGIRTLKFALCKSVAFQPASIINALRTRLWTTICSSEINTRQWEYFRLTASPTVQLDCSGGFSGWPGCMHGMAYRSL